MTNILKHLRNCFFIIALTVCFCVTSTYQGQLPHVQSGKGCKLDNIKYDVDETVTLKSDIADYSNLDYTLLKKRCYFCSL